MPGVIPYLIRAYCDWIEDNSLTPYLLVNTQILGVIAPKGLVRQGIILSFKGGSSKSNMSSAGRRVGVYGYLLEVLLPSR